MTLRKPEAETPFSFREENFISNCREYGKSGENKLPMIHDLVASERMDVPGRPYTTDHITMEPKSRENPKKHDRKTEHI